MKVKINLKLILQEESTPSVPNGTNDAPGANDYDSDEFDSEEPTDSDSYGGTENDDELEVSTAQSLEDALKDLASNEGWENVYLELPKLDLKHIVIPNAEVHSRFDEWNEFLEVHDISEEKSLVMLIGNSKSSRNLLRKKSTIWSKSLNVASQQTLTLVLPLLALVFLIALNFIPTSTMKISSGK